MRKRFAKKKKNLSETVGIPGEHGFEKGS